MLIRTLIGMVIGGLFGLGGNYMCMITGGACPLLSKKVIAVILCALIGGALGAMSAGK